jgi:hypothetical protein
MRFLFVGLVFASRLASADPEDSQKPWNRENHAGVSLEVGGGWQRIQQNGITYRAEYLRFAPQVSLNRWLYIGGGLQFGHIYGGSGMLEAQPYDPVGNLFDESTGTIVSGQALVGARGFFGIVSGAFEIAPTERWTNASANSAYATFSTSATMIELHGRLDVWATPHFSAGIMAGADTESIHDFEAGVQLAFHFEPYDTMKRR